jgi:hypothetical protein
MPTELSRLYLRPYTILSYILHAGASEFGVIDIRLTRRVCIAVTVLTRIVEVPVSNLDWAELFSSAKAFRGRIWQQCCRAFEMMSRGPDFREIRTQGMSINR